MAQPVTPDPSVHIEEWEVLDLLTSLVDKSLAVYEEDAPGGGRYRLLETVRQYTRDRLLESGVSLVARDRHRDWCLKLAAEAAAFAATPAARREVSAAGVARWAAWLDRLDLEHDNLRAALDWCATDADHGESGLRLAGHLYWFWNERGYWSEGRQRLGDALALTDITQGSTTLAKALLSAGAMAVSQADWRPARALLQQALAVSEQVGDTQSTADALSNLGSVAMTERDFETASTCFAKSLMIYRGLREQDGMATAIYSLGIVAFYQEDYEAAQAQFEAAHAVNLAQGHHGGYARLMLGKIALLKDDYATARMHYEQFLQFHGSSGNKPEVAVGLGFLGELMRYQGNHERAAVHYSERLALTREMGSKHLTADSLLNLGYIALAQDNQNQARTHFIDSLEILRQVQIHSSYGQCLAGVVCLLAAQSRWQEAAKISGIIEAHLTSMKVRLETVNGVRYKHCLATTRAVLGKQAFEAVQAEGRVTPVEQALEYARLIAGGLPSSEAA